MKPGGAALGIKSAEVGTCDILCPSRTKRISICSAPAAVRLLLPMNRTSQSPGATNDMSLCAFDSAFMREVAKAEVAANDAKNSVSSSAGSNEIIFFAIFPPLKWVNPS